NSWSDGDDGTQARPAPAPGCGGARVERQHIPRGNLSEGGPAARRVDQGGDGRGVLSPGVCGARASGSLTDDRIPDLDLASGVQDLRGGRVFLGEQDHQLADYLDGRQIVVVVLPDLGVLEAAVVFPVV